MSELERKRKLYQLLEAALDTQVDSYQFAIDATKDDPDLRKALLDLLQLEVPTRFFQEQPSLDLGNLLSASWHEGYRLGAYEIEAELARGGMGAVYRARRADASFDKKVAIKIMRPSLYSPEILERFHEERQILARLEHPNIARLLDGGATPEGIPYLVMEYIEGSNLIQYCESNALNLEARLALFNDLCAAVNHAHRRLIAHRDLKPDNIMVTPDGQLKLLDFGIARILEDRENLQKTRTGQRLMSPLYASPEQIQGREITTATDIYSLGVILFQLCSGSLPYFIKNNSPEELSRLIADSPPMRLAQAFRRQLESEPAQTDTTGFAHKWRMQSKTLERKLKGDLEAIVLKCLDKDPSQRYASVEGLGSDLSNFHKNLPITATRYNTGTILLKLMARHKVVTSTIALLIVLSINFIVQLSLKNTRIEEERDRAQYQQARAESAAQFVVELFSRPSLDKDNQLDMSAHELLERIQKDLEAGHREKPLDRAMSYRLLAVIQHNLGNEDKAHDLFMTALTYLEQPGVGSPEDSIDIYLDLSKASHQTGNHEEAEFWLRKGIKQFQLSMEKGVPIKTLAGTTLGPVMILRGAKDVLKIDQQPVDSAHPQANAIAIISRRLNDLGYHHFRREDYKRAETLFREAYDLTQQLSTRGNLDLSSSMINLGLCMSLLRSDPAPAEALLRDALRMNRNLYGKSRRTTATLHSLATHFVEHKQYSQALAALNEERRMIVGLSGPKGSDLIANYHLQGRLENERHHYEEALKLHRKALQQYELQTSGTYPQIKDLLATLSHLESRNAQNQE